jgi:hypothetical protein
MTQTRVTTWRNYVFTTDLRCANGHPPGAHPLYIGQSSRPDLRFGQHADQPWREYATGFQVYPQAYGSERESLDAEEWRIRTLLPLANREHNWDNPCRLDFGPHREATPHPRRATRARRRRLRRRWPRWARRLAWRAGVWLTLAGGLWWLSGSLVGAVAVASVLLVAAGRRRRRR